MFLYLWTDFKTVKCIVRRRWKCCCKSGQKSPNNYREEKVLLKSTVLLKTFKALQEIRGKEGKIRKPGEQVEEVTRRFG